RRQDSNTRRQMLSPFEEEMNQWFDSELDIAKLSAQEYSNLCINHIRDLLSSVDAHRKPSALLAEVEAAAEAYRQRLAALSEFLKYPEAPVGEEGLPVLWLLHELEQFRRNSSTQTRLHLGEDISRACALVRLILLARPSGEYYEESSSKMKGTPSSIDDKTHGGSIIDDNNKENTPLLNTINN
ncbi:G patch domain-containing protein 1, partial [Perkinsus olseni]